MQLDVPDGEFLRSAIDTAMRVKKRSYLKWVDYLLTGLYVFTYIAFIVGLVGFIIFKIYG
jgi:hypothetical protein